MTKEMARSSTFQFWVKEPSSQVVEIPVPQFLEENPGYQSEYMELFNAIRTAGATVKKGVWRINGRSFDNVKECFDWLKIKGVV